MTRNDNGEQLILGKEAPKSISTKVIAWFGGRLDLLALAVKDGITIIAVTATLR